MPIPIIDNIVKAASAAFGPAGDALGAVLLAIIIVIIVLLLSYGVTNSFVWVGDKLFGWGKDQLAVSTFAAQRFRERMNDSVSGSPVRLLSPNKTYNGFTAQQAVDEIDAMCKSNLPGGCTMDPRQVTDGEDPVAQMTASTSTPLLGAAIAAATSAKNSFAAEHLTDAKLAQQLN